MEAYKCSLEKQFSTPEKPTTMDEAIELAERLNSLTKEVDDETFFRFYDEKIELYEKLIKEQGGKKECQDYALFHYLIGSSWRDCGFEKIDFPGNIIKKFLEDQIEKLQR